MNQYNYINDELFCENVSLKNIAQKFGTPTFIYSKNSILNAFNEFDSAFKTLPHLTCYSVKANSNLSVIKILSDRGAGIDCNSGGEFFRALKVGVNPKKIIYTGVGKTEEEIRFVLSYPILMLKVESFQELDLVNKIAGEMNVVAPIGIRINPNIDAKTHPYISTGLIENKFGIPISDSLEAFKYVTTLPNLKIIGVDTHIGSQILDAEPFVETANSLLNFTLQLKNVGIKIEHIDIGGGLGIDYETHQARLTPKELSEKISPILLKTNSKIIFEPGRFITANSGALLTKVLFTKKNNSKNFVIVDSAMNDLLRPAFYDAFHEIIPVVKNNQEKIKVDVVGPVCESGDFFAKDRLLQSVNQNDLVAILSAGAYGFVMSSNYNSRRRAAEVIVDGDNFHLIRKRESFEDLIQNENL
ncbi:MAG: diaminopimelate decarboxylase [Bacteroidota bacterium]